MNKEQDYGPMTLSKYVELMERSLDDKLDIDEMVLMQIQALNAAVLHLLEKEERGKPHE